MRTPAILLSVPLVLYGCGDPAPPNGTPTKHVTQRVVGGEPSDPKNDAVVLFESDSQACTATVVAPRMVVTARHCVGQYTEGQFTCTVDGNVSSSSPRIPANAGAIGPPDPPEELTVRIGVAPWADEPAAIGEKVYVVPTDSICKNDIALVRLDRDVAPKPRTMRLTTPTYPGDLVTVVGYGMRDIDFVGRVERSGIPILKVGESLLYPEGSGAYDRTFSIGKAVCPGDSGGPAIDDETGAILGVFSNITGDCMSTGARNYYTQLAPYADFIEEAFADSGFEVPYETEPGPGAGGGAGETSTGGSPSDGSSSSTGGSGVSGSGGAAAGGITTSASGGSSAGGTSPGETSSGGSANGGSDGGIEDTRPPKDNCNCRVAGGGRESPSGLLALFGLLGLSLARRRATRG